MPKKPPTPQPRPNLTPEERAKLIEHMDKAGKNLRLPAATRAERRKMADQLRAIQAKRISQQSATPKA